MAGRIAQTLESQERPRFEARQIAQSGQTGIFLNQPSNGLQVNWNLANKSLNKSKEESIKPV